MTQVITALSNDHVSDDHVGLIPRLLLVDDRTENLVALTRALNSETLHIDTAQSGPEALKLAAEHEYALIILDVRMPVMNGFEVAKHLRAAERTSTLPIIFVTAGDSNQEIVEAGYDSGAVDYLSKPISIPILKCKIHVFVSLYRQRKQLEAERDARTALAESLAAYMHELEESETRFNNIITSSSDGMAVIDSSGFVRFVNPAVEQIMHRPGRQLLDKPFDVVVRPGTVTSAEFTDTNGIATTAELRTTKTVWEGKPALLVSFRDITERQRRENQTLLHERRKAFDLVARNVGHSILEQSDELLTVLSELADGSSDRFGQQLQRGRSAATHVNVAARELSVLATEKHADTHPIDFVARITLLEGQFNALLYNGPELILTNTVTNGLVSATEDQVDALALSAVAFIRRCQIDGTLTVEINDVSLGACADDIYAVSLTVYGGNDPNAITVLPFEVENKAVNFHTKIINDIVREMGGRLELGLTDNSPPALRVTLPVTTPVRMNSPRRGTPMSFASASTTIHPNHRR